jgi:hypothetical protein
MGRRISKKLLPTSAVRGVSRGHRNGSPRLLISVFYTGAAIFSFEQLLNYPYEAEWVPSQAQEFSENVVAPGVEPGTSGSVARAVADL